MTSIKITYGLLGFLLGIILTGLVAYSSASEMVVLENESKYGFDETVEKIKQAATEKGWKVPAVHRIDKSVNKEGYFVQPVAVIELCNPDHAAKILEVDENKVVSSMMPCRVSVYKTRNGKIIISRMNSGLISKVFNESVAETMDKVTKETDDIFASVIK